MDLRDFQLRDRIILYGCGGHTRSIINVIREAGYRKDIILIDDNVKRDEIILGCRTQRRYDLRQDDDYIVAVGDNRKRAQQYQELLGLCRGHCRSVVAFSAYIGMEAEIGVGTFVASNTYIGPQAIVGNNTIINTGSIIEHETRIGDNTHIAPHATVCGRVRIGNYVFCGAGSIIIDTIEICDNVIIGAGTVVKEKITEPGTYVGIPARKVSGTVLKFV